MMEIIMPNPPISFPANFTPVSGVAFANTDNSAQPVSAATPLPVAAQGSLSGAVALAAGSATGVSFANFSSINVQVDGLSGADVLSFTGSSSASGVYYPLQVMTMSGTFGTISNNVSANGIYALPGGGRLFIKVAQTGAASTPVITATAGQ
jgi:uncharacterized secreted protein with C-terminal beta-propeller domain